MTSAVVLSTLYESHLKQRPHAVAFIDGEKTITYAQFDEMVRRTAAWAQDHGIVQGDNVAVWLVNRLEWLAWFFGLARVGAALVAVNTRYRSHELHYILERSHARMLVMQTGFHRIDFAGILDGVPGETLPYLEAIVMLDQASDAADARLLDRPVLRFDLASADPTTAPARQDADRPTIFFTTSGTTKGPKLVIHTAATLVTHTRKVAQRFELDRRGVVHLTALPFCGVFGLNSVLGALHAGAPIVLMDVFDAQRAVSDMIEHKVTHFFGSDEMLRRVGALAQGDRPFPALRLAAFAAFSAGSAALAEELGARGFPLRGLYGSSEVQALFSLQPAEAPLERRAAGGGLPASDDLARVRARNPETGELCANEVPGELEISSPTNFVGYLNNPEATASALTDDGYFRTGDLGYTLEDGSFVYLARIGDAMRLGGFLVDPSEIEYAVGLQPGVAAVQVVSVEIDGRARPVAFVRAADSGVAGDPAQWEKNLAAELASFKVPARFWVVDAFPATESANGLKVQRVKLREMAMERLAQEQAEPPSERTAWPPSGANLRPSSAKESP